MSDVSTKAIEEHDRLKSILQTHTIMSIEWCAIIDKMDIVDAYLKRRSLFCKLDTPTDKSGWFPVDITTQPDVNWNWDIYRWVYSWVSSSNLKINVSLSEPIHYHIKNILLNSPNLTYYKFRSVYECGLFKLLEIPQRFSVEDFVGGLEKSGLYQEHELADIEQTFNLIQLDNRKPDRNYGNRTQRRSAKMF